MKMKAIATTRFRVPISWHLIEAAQMNAKRTNNEYSYGGVYLATSFSGFMLIPYILSSNFNGLELLVLCIVSFMVLVATPARSLVLSRPHRKFFLSFYIFAPAFGYLLRFIPGLWYNLIFVAILIAYIAYFIFNIKTIVAVFKT